MNGMLTRKVAIVELAIVTAGVLIALSFDGIREWRAHQVLAAEARANLLSEIRGNKNELDGVLKNFDKHQQNYRDVYNAVANLLADKPLGATSLQIGHGIANLTAAAYATAQVTGAFSYMKYEEVRSFSGLYDMQAKYDELQDGFSERVGGLMGPLLLAGSPEAADRATLERYKPLLQDAIGALHMQRQLGEGLSKAYGELLAKN